MAIRIINPRDEPLHKGLRRSLIQILRKKGITDERVLAAMERIPRHIFLDSALAKQAYEDKALPIGQGQTISQPYTVAYQTQLLDAAPGMKVLEVGTGSGYQGSILCELKVQLYSIERIKELILNAESIFKHFKFSPKLKLGDGSLGWATEAPFDRIIVTAGAPSIISELAQQLKPNGILIIPVGDKVQTMYKIVRDKNGDFTKQKLQDFRFVPLIGKAAYPKNT